MQAPWWRSKTETCRSDIYVYFNVNYNVFFKIKKCICWWVKSTYGREVYKLLYDLKLRKALLSTCRNMCCSVYILDLCFQGAIECKQFWLWGSWKYIIRGQNLAFHLLWNTRQTLCSISDERLLKYIIFRPQKNS